MLKEHQSQRRLASDLVQLYWALFFYNRDLERPYLTELISDQERIEAILDDPKEHEKDFRWLCRICNTEGAEEMEEKRKRVLQEITELAKLGKISDISATLLPASDIDAVAKEIMDFYHDYSPYDFAMSQDGWFDDVGEPTHSFETAFRTNDDDVKDIFENLHAVIDCIDAEEAAKITEEEKERAQALIDHMKKFSDDPVPANLRVVICDPRHDAETLLIPNSIDMFDNFNGQKFIERELGNGIWVAFPENGKSDNLEKNRMLYDQDGKKLGTARGTVIFFSKDRYGSHINLSDEQYEQVMNMYGEAQLFKREPMTAERKESLLKKTAEELSKDGYGAEKLKRIGFTPDEIEELLPRQGQKNDQMMKSVKKNITNDNTQPTVQKGAMRVR